MNFRFLILLSVLSLLLSLNLKADSQQYYYKQIKLHAGLPTTLTCIYADSRGFIWSGTKSGLGRFDGNIQQRFMHEEKNAASLAGNIIYQITEDKEGNIWVLTNGGVSIYNYQTNEFSGLSDENGKNCQVYSICHWNDRLVLGGDREIFIYDASRHCLKKIYELDTPQNFPITDIKTLNLHTLYCSSRWNGIYRVDFHKNETQKVFHECGNEIPIFMIDSKQRFWISSYNKGVFCYDSSENKLAHFTTANSSLRNNIVVSMTERLGSIWLGTDGGGINILQPESNQMTFMEHVPGDAYYSLPTNSINYLHCDQYSNIWIGGVYSGLINVRQVNMRTYTESQRTDHSGLSNNIVLSLYEESPDSIWIGTDGGGINLFNPITGRFTHFQTTARDKITSICPLGPGKLLLAVFSDGLYEFDIKTGAKTSFHVIDEHTTNTLCRHGNSVYFYRNSPHTILILGDHVYIYDLDKRTFSIAEEDSNHSVYWGTLQAVAHKSNTTYLFDHTTIYELNHATQELKVIFSCPPDIQIKSMTLDENGLFWLGNNLGLCCFDPVTHRLSTVSTNLFFEASLVKYSPQGIIWIGSENRLFAYLPAENQFLGFGESDGVISNQYLAHACLLTQNHHVYLGGINGLLHINNLWKPIKTKEPEIQLSSVTLNGQPVTNFSGEKEDILNVPFNSHVSIQIMAKEEDIFRRKLYRYRVEGFSQYNTESYSSEMIMRALQPGHYRILASCTAKDGAWVPEQHILELVVTPPWYQTWWAITLFVITAFLLIIGGVLKIFKMKDKRLKEMLNEHEKQVYEEKVRFLINISHELRTPLTLIYAPLKRILNKLPSDNDLYKPLSSICRQSQRMQMLIDMVLDVRKMEVGEIQLKIQRHLFNEWIREVTDDFAEEGKARNIQFVLQLDENIQYLSFDKDKCSIVLNNLLINALKHSPESTAVTVSSKWLTDTNEVELTVSDQGRGLEGVDKNKLFTRFYQGSNELQGSGIGLSYSKILIEQQQGHIGAYNNASKGASFYFRIPYRQTCEEYKCPAGTYLNALMQDTEQPLSNLYQDFSLSAYRVLVVDDNVDLVNFLRESMKTCFKQVLVAYNGVEALEITRSHCPDIIVSDVMMPRMNGYELCANIKKNMDISHIPVILLTARHDEQSQKDGYKSGADAYLMKPFEIDTLLELIKNRLYTLTCYRKECHEVGQLPVPEDITISLVDEKFLVNLNKIITSNLDNTSLDIAFICKEIGMSRASLYNKLKVLTDMGANEYITKQRMEQAIRLILTTSLTFSEIADKCGFKTSSYFSTAFKRYTGESPIEYKKHHTK